MYIFEITKFFLFILIILININKLINNNKLSHIINKTIKVCICTLGKNENRYIIEFVEYYKKYGVDKIFLYDNNDKNGEAFEEVISKYINNGFVKLLNWRGKKRKQIYIFNHCYKKNYRKYDWLIFYDIDEYINLRNYSNIKKFLMEKKFNRCQIIYLNWAIHTDNNLIHYENKSLHKRFPILESNARKKNKNIYIPVKSILKGHVPNIKINSLHQLNPAIEACDGLGNKPKIDKYYMEPDFSHFFIDHYYFKSLEEFVEKLNKGSARTYDHIDIKKLRFHRYFTMNEVNINKIKYIENKTKLNIARYIKYLKNISFINLTERYYKN